MRADPAVAQRLCRVHVHLRDKRSFAAVIDTPVGQPGFAEIARFAHAPAPEMGATRSAVDRLINAVADLDHAPDTRELIAAVLAA